jgi:preprotein translocase subunit SecG
MATAAAPSETFGNTMPAVIAGLVSAPVAARLLLWLTDERELLFFMTCLVALLMIFFNGIMLEVFKLDDGVIDRFERATLRPFAFLIALLSFLVLQFGLALMNDTLLLFRTPGVADFLQTVVMILGIIFFFVPIVVAVTQRAQPPAETKES